MHHLEDFDLWPGRAEWQDLSKGPKSLRAKVISQQDTRGSQGAPVDAFGFGTGALNRGLEA
jgi:hypothetical protein